MNVQTLIVELQKADPHDEVILFVEHIGCGPDGETEVYKGKSYRVLCVGHGAPDNKCEIFAKG